MAMESDYGPTPALMHINPQQETMALGLTPPGPAHEYSAWDDEWR